MDASLVRHSGRVRFAGRALLHGGSHGRDDPERRVDERLRGAVPPLHEGPGPHDRPELLVDERLLADRMLVPTILPADPRLTFFPSS
jgi:hypothetical protein